MGIVQHHSFHFISTWRTGRVHVVGYRGLVHIGFRTVKLAAPTYGDLDKFVFDFDFWVHGIHLIPVSCVALCSTTFLFFSVRQRKRYIWSFACHIKCFWSTVVPLALLQVWFEASKFSLYLNCVQSNACVLILGGQCDYQIDAKFWKIISNQHGVNLPRGSTAGLDRGARPGVLMEDSIGGLLRGVLPGGSMEGLRHGGGAVRRRPELPSGRREHRRVHAVGQRSFVQHLFPDSFSDDPHLRKSTGRHPHSLPSPSFFITGSAPLTSAVLSSTARLPCQN